jgi:hypothetical protein
MYMLMVAVARDVLLCALLLVAVAVA